MTTPRRKPEIVAAGDVTGLQLVWLPVTRREDFEAAFAEAGRPLLKARAKPTSSSA
jgi:hypothetical protein